MSTPQEQIDALSRGLNSADVGRRVGWARAFSAESSKEDLSRQVNMLRAERDIMRRAASYVYGFLQTWGVGNAQQYMKGDLDQIGAVLDDTAKKAGALRALDARADRLSTDEKLVKLIAERQAFKTDQKRVHNSAWKAGRDQERKLLMNQFGFPNEAAFLNYLEQYARLPH